MEIASLPSLNSISKDDFKTMSKYFLQTVVTGSSDVSVGDHLEKALCTLSTFLLEAAKIRCTNEALRYEHIVLSFLP